MKRFKNILVVCQEECQPELSIRQAAILAERNNATVTLVDVVSLRESEMAGFAIGAPSSNPADIKSRFTNYHRTRLAGLARPLRDKGINTVEHVLWGIPFVEIIREVLRNDHDLVIKAVTPPLAGQPNVLGGMDMHLMRKCPCPVWILKDQLDREDLRVLAAVDPDSGDQTGLGLNRPIMELSKSLCDSEAGQLHVLHAWELPEERALMSDASEAASPEQIKQIKSEVRRLHASRLDQVIAPYTGDDGKMHVHLAQGKAGDLVTEFVPQHNIDLVVMGTVNRTDVAGLFMGNTAEIILSRVSCSVLAVKPDGFKTPIELPQKITQAANTSHLSAVS